MISRSAFLISAALLFAMLAATISRLMLLPDWTHFPYFGPGGVSVSPRNSLWLLTSPACVLFFAGVLALVRWSGKATPEQARSWTRWGSSALIVYAAIGTALQLFVLARSLGVGLALNPTSIGRAVIVLTACLLIVMANYMPKLPLFESRIKALNLDLARRAQFVRFSSQMIVLMGLFFIVIGVAAPVFKIALWIFSASGAGLVIVYARLFLLLRDSRRDRAASKV